MCLISDKIKFCTCTKVDVTSEKHYWAFYRNIDPNATPHLGVTLGNTLDRATFYQNITLLLNRLNEPDAFDIDLSPQENDFLMLAFTFNEKRGHETLGFVFTNGKWVWHHTSFFFPKLVKEGCIQSPFSH